MIKSEGRCLQSYQIEEVKNYFDEEDELDDDSKQDFSLVFQHQPPTTKEEILDTLPERHVVDRLVSCYFKASNPSQRGYSGKWYRAY